MSWNVWIAGLVPSIGVGLLFWYVMRSVVRADRNERAALAEIEARRNAVATDSDGKFS
jgi:hypothetical protein